MMFQKEYVWLAGLWIAWCVVHSAMISLTVTRYLENRLGSYYKFYRLFFNGVSLITVSPLILYTVSLGGRVLFRWQGYLTFIQIVLLLTALFLFIAGGVKYDMLQFLGIRQIKSGKSYAAISESGGIETSGILGITRHPWYLAGILFLWTYYREMYVSTLIVSSILTVYLLTGTFLEQRKLIIKFGDSYRHYMKRVSMLLPAKWIVSKLSKITRQVSCRLP